MNTYKKSTLTFFCNQVGRILTLAVVVSLLPLSQAFAAETETFGMIASVGAGPNDQDIILSRRVDQTITFKYCIAKKKDGTPTPVAEYRKSRFKNSNLESDTASFQNFKKSLFEQTEVCQLIGRPLYGINKELLNRGYPTRELWDSSYDTYYMWGMAGGLGAFLIGGFQFVVHYSSDVNRSNTISFFKRIGSNPAIGSRAAISLVGLLTLGGFIYAINDHSNVRSGIESLAPLTENINASKANIIESSVPEMRKAFELAIQVATKHRTLIEL